MSTTSLPPPCTNATPPPPPASRSWTPPLPTWPQPTPDWALSGSSYDSSSSSSSTFVIVIGVLVGVLGLFLLVVFYLKYPKKDRPCNDTPPSNQHYTMVLRVACQTVVTNVVRMGIGGVLQDSNGKWIEGFSGCLGDKSVLFAELMAIKVGLNMVWEKGYRFVWCESVSLHAITLLTSNSWSKHHTCVEVLTEVSHLLKRDWVVRLSHGVCEINTCVDEMAQLGCTNDDAIRFWQTPPPILLPHLNEDFLGSGDLCG